MNIDEIKFIHSFLVDYFHGKDDPVSPPGIKNEELLQSSVARPFMSAGGKDAYPGVFEKAAALFHSVINNHCFHNGNKRTALLSTMSYLGENGYWLTVPTDEEMFEFTRKAAAHEICDSRDDELDYICSWLTINSRKRKGGEQMLKFADLKEILTGFGYEYGEFDGQGRSIELIKDGKRVAKVLQKGNKGKEDYDKQYIHNLRRKLGLTIEYGIDSYAFYGERGFANNLSEFMRLRNKVMRELAKI